jgi:hypothetical protein
MPSTIVYIRLKNKALLAIEGFAFLTVAQHSPKG